MKNAIIEINVINGLGEKEKFTATSDLQMKEFLIYNENFKLISARKIVLLQTYNKETEEFEWI